MSGNIVSINIQNVDTTVDKHSDCKKTIANDVNKSQISSKVEKCSTNETKDSATEEYYMHVDEYPSDAEFNSKSAELTVTEGSPLESERPKINSESVELTKGSPSDQEMPEINSESAELTKEFPPDPETNLESAELTKGSPSDPQTNSESAELTEGSANLTKGSPPSPKAISESANLTKGSPSDQEMPEINSESAELTKEFPSDPETNLESAELTKGSPSDPETNSESAELTEGSANLTKGSPPSPKAISESANLTKGSPSDPQTNSESAELIKGSATDDYMLVDEDQSDIYINSESAEQSDCEQDIIIDSASGGSGSEKELRALRSDTCPKTKRVVKSKTKSKKTVKTTKGKKQTKEANYQQSDSGSDTDPVIKSKKEEPTDSSKKKKMGNLFSPKYFKPTLYKRWSDKDTEQYRNGYPGKKDILNYRANQEFYMNQIVSYPDGDKIDDIHEKWWGKHRLLENHHGYIQWLFPIRESGMNMHAQELQLHEAKAINADSNAHARILKSYEMMLEFYGVNLVDTKSGQLARGDNWQDRFQHLNMSMHNYLRITRILKSLGEFNYEHLKEPFVRYMITEALKEKTLKNTASSCMNYWVGTIKDDRQRQKLREYAIELGYKDF